MQLKSLSTLLIAFIVVFSFGSCKKKTNTQGRYIPENAVFVAHFNGESINAKLPWEEVKNNAAFKMAYADSSVNAIAKTAMDNPENTGIDVKADMILYVVKDSSGGYIGFQGKVKDVAKFKSFYAEVLKNGTASQKDGVDYLTKERVSISWDKDKFIMVSDLPEMNKLKELETSNPFDSSYTPTPVISTRNTIATAAALYTLKEDKSLAKEERFSKMVNDKADMHFWVNAEALYKDMPGMEQFAMMNLSKLYEDSRMAASANFENGQIKADLVYYGGKEMTELYKKYSGKSVDADMASQLPNKDVAVFFAMNFKPEGIKEFIKLTGMDGLINMGIAMLGFNIDDFVKANKGDIMFSMYDFTTDSFGIAKPKVLFAASIGDKASFDKLVAAGVKAGKNEPSAAEQISYAKNDKYFVIGNDKAGSDGFINGKAGNKPSFWDKLKSGPMAGYVNLQVIMNSFKQQAQQDSLGAEALNASLKFWDDIIISGGQFKDGGLTQHFEVNLMDKNTNSLKQLNKYVDELAIIAKKKKDEQGKVVSTDIIAAPLDSTVTVDLAAPVK